MDLHSFSFRDMTALGAHIRAATNGGTAMVDVAGRLAQLFCDQFRRNDQPTIALARVYKTHPFGALPRSLQQFAAARAGVLALSDHTMCLTLLGSHGVEPAWCAPHSSRDHRAIPLPSADVVERIPMVAQLMSQLGVPVTAIVEPLSFVETSERTYNVFFVEAARGSPAIPAQDFVATYRIESVIGFGGSLLNNELFAVILFSRVAITREVAELFRPLALNVKLALLAHSRQIFTREATL